MSELIPTQPNEIEILQDQPMDRNPAAVYLAKLRPSGRRSQESTLSRIARIMTNGAIDNPLMIRWQKLRYSHVAALKARIQEDPEINAVATVNKYLAAIRGVAREAWRLDLMDADDYMKIKSIEPMVGETLPAGRYVTPGEILALMRNCEEDPGPAGVRDAALIGLMSKGGLRREEVIKLDLADFNPDDGELKVKGKRGKDRTLYLENGALDAMRDWIHIRSNEPGPLFNPINRGGCISPRRMSTQAIYLMLKARSDEAGVADLSPHDLRRTAASDLLENNDAMTVAKIMGHKNMNTTLGYDRRGETVKKNAAKTLFLPYKRKFEK